jgi:serine/threonine protein kinase/Tfp pilus assembly protein PilF
MGEVYKARDTRLDRAVAIKVLLSNLSSNPELRARFDREAKAISSLSHPNICTLYDVGHQEGHDFLVMEFLEGETLADRLKTGPLPIDEVLKISIEIADALDKAHCRGMVHRDLKPANLFLTGHGATKILDFGLAKTAIDEDNWEGTTISSEHQLTGPGTAVGTVAYMSPEQARGEPLDARSDLFSFGVLLYEATTGCRPFMGATTAILFDAILNRPPKSVTELNAKAPAALERIITRLLAKSPASRYQSAQEVLKELGAASDAFRRGFGSSGTVPHTTPSIALLPFANLSADPDQEYFSDGLGAEIINALVKVPGLKVIARTSAFAFKGQNTDIRKIAEVLGVANILEGSVRRAGNRIRVTAQLITAADGSHLWSERYDRQMEDIFAVQDEIAAAIAAELKLKFAPDPTAHPRRQPNFKAYDAYLRYLHYQWGFTQDSLRRSRECLEQAIALDPEFALPYAGMADHHFASTIVGVRADEAMPRARELARRALELDPDLPEAHAILGIAAGTYDLDWKEAERRFRLATAHEPVPWHVRNWHSFFYLFSVGRFQEARREAQRTLEDDPLSPINYLALGVISDGLGLKEEARAAYEKALELDPQFWWGWQQFGMHHAIYGSHADGRDCAEKAIAMFPSSPRNIGLLAGVLQNAGETARAEELLAQLPAGSYGSPVARMCFHLVCGQIDAALEWAGQAVDERNPTVIPMVIRPFERLFRNSPGWPALLKKMNLAEAP